MARRPLPEPRSKLRAPGCYSLETVALLSQGFSCCGGRVFSARRVHPAQLPPRTAGQCGLDTPHCELRAVVLRDSPLHGRLCLRREGKS
jgi:hypothetical protein